LKTATSTFVPYDAAAVIVEVKALMDKEKLESDLQKLEKVAKLELTPERIGMALGSSFNIQRPLRILVYFAASIKEEEKQALLTKYHSVWDAILVLAKDVIILNLSLLIANAIVPDQYKQLRTLDWVQNPFVILLLLIVASVPVPLGVNVLQTLINLDTFSKRS